MPNYRVVSLLALVAAIFAAPLPAPAAPLSGHAVSQRDSVDFAAQTKRRPRVVIYPRYRRLSPNARRICRAWLAQEYRPSGTVVTPQMQCWWQQ